MRVTDTYSYLLRRTARTATHHLPQDLVEEGGAAAKIAEGGWDAVVLQEDLPEAQQKVGELSAVSY